MRHLRVDVLSSHWPRRWPRWTSVKRRSNRSEVHRPLVDVDLEQENSIKNLPMAHRPDLKLQKKICDMNSMTRFGDFLDFGQLFKAFATTNRPKSLTFLGKFCKGVKIFHFSSEIIFGQLL